MKVVKITDGLGNQMFQYAYALSCAVNNHERVYLDKRFINSEDELKRGEFGRFRSCCGHREYALDAFNISLPLAGKSIEMLWFFVKCDNWFSKICFLLASERKKFFPIVEEKGEYQESLTQKSVFPEYVHGYFFHLKYFEDIRPLLLHEFVPKKNVRITLKLRDLFEQRVTVGIHIRRGDFLSVKRSTCSKQYYMDAVDYVAKRARNLVILLFSDDKDWVKEHIKFPFETVYVGDEAKYKDYEEMMIMKMCNHNIIANSTFGFWGAWLNEHNDKIVIAPKGWKRKIIPEEWIKM